MTLRSVIASGANIHPPHWLADNLCYETIMGSDAYGVSSGSSDTDVYGICLPPKEMVFPHLAGEILGFGNQIKRFETWQEHHVKVPGTWTKDDDGARVQWADGGGKEWDFQVMGIVKFFQLAMENNPNVIDCVYTPRRCVLSSTAIGEYIREHRDDFLHKGAWHKFKGYAYSQLHKIKTKKPTEGAKRAELVEQHGYDVKFAYHVVRLLLEVEQILVEHTIDLERHREQLKAIRRGEWTLEQLVQWAQDKERDLEAVYTTSTLRHSPDEPLVRRHLMHCLEHHYGDLSRIIHEPTRAEAQVAAIRKILGT